MGETVISLHEKKAEEEWREIEENCLYEVSNMGRVRVKERTRSCGKNGKSKRTYAAQIMALFLHDNGKGNKNVVVKMRDGKKQIRRSVAKLVLLAFVGNPPKQAKQAVHLDGNPLNNALSNLRWDVDKSYFLPKNQEARALFHKYAISFVRGYITHKNLWRSKMIDADDFMSECLLKIWEVIDVYDSSHCSFKRFVYIKCEWIFKKLYAKMARRKEIAPIINFSDMATDERPLDYIKELSYEEKFYGD